MSDSANTKELLTLTTEIVAAHVSKNTVPAADLPQLIAQVYQSLANVGKGQAQTAERPDPSSARDDPAAYLARLALAGQAAELLDPAGLGGFGWLLQSRGPWPEGWSGFDSP